MTVLQKKNNFINFYKKSLPEGTHPKWVEFVDTYFQSASSRALEESSENVGIAYLLKESWRQFQAVKYLLSSKEVKLQHYYDPLKKTLMLTIIQTDQPFLVETLKTHLNAYHLKVEQIFHPIFCVKRDKKTGEILDFYSSKQKLQSDYIFESLISLEIKWNESEEAIQEFLEKLSWRLHMLQIAIADWPKMRQTIQKCVPRSHHLEWGYLDWLLQDNFIFLGFRTFLEDSKPKKNTRRVVEESVLGLFKDAFYKNHKSLLSFEENERRSLIFSMYKTSIRSPINRSARLEILEVHDKKNDTVHQIIGIFTRRSYNHSVLNIPIVRKKAENIFTSFGLQRSWHDGKVLMQALESIPHDEYWYVSEKEIAEICTKAIGFQENSLPVFISHGTPSDQSQTFIIFLGRERYSLDLKNTLGKALERETGGEVSSTRGIVDEVPFARIIYVLDHLKKKISSTSIQECLTRASLTWEERRLSLVKDQGQKNLYEDIFNGAYPKDFTPEHAVLDGELLYNMGPQSLYGIRLELSDTPLDQTFKINVSLKIFSRTTPLELTYLLGVLQNFGVTVAQEKTYSLGEFFLHNCLGILPPLDNHHQESLTQIIQKTLNYEHPNDLFNKIFTLCHLNERQVHVFRSLFHYIKQWGQIYDQKFFVHTLIEHPHITHTLLQLFETKFDPKISSVKRARFHEEYQDSFGVLLDDVTHPLKDQLFRTLHNLMEAMVRTNYFMEKPSLSLKFECAKITSMQDPRPYVEVYVNAYDMEGVHLRTSKVARGGIRHSDRPDYRSEIMQLMQAQDLKNSIIVPTGAKGGFRVKKQNPTRDDVVESYKNFISSLLDITDNSKDGKIVHPLNLVAYDGEDAYFVVAADKGTATFSDIANDLALHRDFWLGDAFASGGSRGYDHKKLGITAKGAFVSVTHHFENLGVNIQNDPITVIGVGDMSGDVFGNGMLTSPALCLIAAFNHQHIFIDPTPDIRSSFEERNRLFNMPQSGWSDYNTGILSQGGGIFRRDAKTLTVSIEIQKLLGVSEKITPDHLMQAILQKDADLLWFGGIGTYIRGEEENYTGDHGNDAIRVSSSQIRARVIGEGANLGITPRGRIELGLQGVLLNSDAIDNAGGVNCSDHEVNLKILVGAQSTPERDAFLETLKDYVVDHVLSANKQQNIALDIMEFDATAKHKNYVNLMVYFERQGVLKRKNVSLDTDDVLRNRRTFLTRPELAILLSIAKNALHKTILENFSSFHNAAFPFVREYFPMDLLQKGAFSIESHLLYKEIATLAMVESSMNFMGPLWFFEGEGEELNRIHLFVELFDAWGVREICQRAIFEAPNQIVKKILNVRLILSQAIPFYERGAGKFFTSLCNDFSKKFDTDMEFADYPYMLGMASKKLNIGDVHTFFSLREGMGIQPYYNALMDLPEDESWQTTQKHSLLQSLFEWHLKVILQEKSEKDINLPPLRQQDYGFLAYVVGKIKENSLN